LPYTDVKDAPTLCGLLAVAGCNSDAPEFSEVDVNGFLVSTNQSSMPSTKQTGDAAEEAALYFLQQQGLRLLQRNYRTPGRGGGEIDLILQESDSTLVFVEVRKRTQQQFGGALGSVSRTKQRRIIFAARYFLWRWRQLPPTRFDVVAWEAEGLIWQKAAFDADTW
jgi:putative endonuclease